LSSPSPPPPSAAESSSACKLSFLLPPPPAPTPLQQQARFLRDQGNAHFRRGAYASARLFYTLGLRVDPRDARGYSNRAAAHLALCQPHLAAWDASECVRIAPKWAKGWFRLAAALLAMEGPARHAAAVECMQRGAALAVTNSETRHIEDMIARSLRRWRSPDTARQLLRCLSRQPCDVHIGDAEFDPHAPLIPSPLSMESLLAV
jgi:hypothetical protein